MNNAFTNINTNNNDQAQSLRKIVNDSSDSNNRDEAISSTNASKARVITITSGKGGVGKTNFSVNFALCLAEKGIRVLIIDADFGLSNVDVLLGISPQYDLSHVIEGKMDIKSVIAEGPYGLKFISGGSGVLNLINMSKSTLVTFVNNLMQLEDLADVIIFDTGAGISDSIMHLIMSSDDTFLITTPEPTSLMDAYAVIKTLNNKYTNDLNMKLIINRVDDAREGMEIGGNFSNVARRYLNFNIDYGGYIIADNDVPRSIKNQNPLVIDSPKSQAAINIKSIAKGYMGILQKPQEASGIKGFLSRLLKAFAQ